MHCPVQERNRESTTWACQLALLSTYCIAASWDISVKCISKDTRVLCPYGHRTSNFTIIIRRSNRLSYAATFRDC